MIVHHVVLQGQILNVQLHVRARRELVMEAHQREATSSPQLCFHHNQLQRLARLRPGVLLL